MNQRNRVSQLEEIQEEKPTRKFNLRGFIADSFSMITFSLPLGMANELLIGGLSLAETARSRAMSLPFNLVTARPYGKYRDWVFSKCGVTDGSSFLKKYLVDTFAFGTFQAPLYAGMLYLSGANREEIERAVGTVTVLSPLIGRACGYYMDYIRRRVGA